MTAASLSPASLLLSKAVEEGESLCFFVSWDFFSAVNLAPARPQMVTTEERHSGIAGVGGCNGHWGKMLKFPF